MKFVVLFLIAFTVINVESVPRHKRCVMKPPPCPPPCPKLYSRPQVDPNNEEAVKQARLDLITSLWNLNNCALSLKAQKLKCAIIEMAQSCDPNLRLTAFIVSVWTWRQLPQIANRPSICSFAAIIDGTLKFEECGCCDKITRGIDLLAASLRDSGNFMSATILTNAGCQAPCVKPTLPPCCETHNGLELWSQLGNQYTCKFKDAAIALINSCKYEDQLLGAIATASTTDALRFFFEYVGPTVASKLLVAQLGGKIPERCCDDYYAQVQELALQIPDIANKAACYTKRQIGCSEY